MLTISAEKICKSYYANHYTVKAVNDITLSVSGNESVAIVGPSGSGKSTLLKMLGLVLTPDSGRILVNGTDVTKLDDCRRSAFRNSMFGYVVQDFALLDDESAYENISIPLIYSKDIKKKEYKSRICAVAKSLDISDKLHRKVAKLSGGERQRVAIARAIVCGQPIILADEPTGSLDTVNKENVMDILLRLSREQNKMLITATHDLSFAEKCKRVIWIEGGKCSDGVDKDDN